MLHHRMEKINRISAAAAARRRGLHTWVWRSRWSCTSSTKLIPFVDCSHSTRLLAATTLRNVLGTKNLAEILSERETISHVMQSSLDDATDPWGVKVERVEMWVWFFFSISRQCFVYCLFPPFWLPKAVYFKDSLRILTRDSRWLWN